MLTGARSREWHEGLLEAILPQRTETALLRACLSCASDRMSAGEAWQEFVDCVDDPKRYFEAASGGLKGLLPFIEDCIRRNDIDAPPRFLTYARVAAVREQLRNRIYREALDETLDALRGAGVSPIVLRGWPLAVSYYATPTSRHNHGIDLMLDAREIQSAAEALLSAGWRHAEGPAGPSTRSRFVHPTGLPVVLSTALFELPHLAAMLEGVRARAVEVQIDGCSVLMPSPEDQLLQVCGHACYSSSRQNLRWVCDAVQIIEVQRDTFDWELFATIARRFRLALPMAVVLHYLRAQMKSHVPEHIVAALRLQHGLSDPVAREAIYAMCTECPTRSIRVRSMRRDMGSWIRLGTFRLLPSRQYVAWKYGVTGPHMIACYLARPVGFLMRRGAQVLKLRRRTLPTTAEAALL